MDFAAAIFGEGKGKFKEEFSLFLSLLAQLWSGRSIGTEQPVDAALAAPAQHQHGPATLRSPAPSSGREQYVKRMHEGQISRAKEIISSIQGKWRKHSSNTETYENNKLHISYQWGMFLYFMLQNIAYFTLQ